MDIITGTVLPIYPDPIGVYVSGDNSVVMIAVEQGLALFSSEAIATPGVAQDQLLASAVVWAPPETWTVTINPRAEWMQMYNDAMRNMRDAFYDPNMHGLDWEGITEMYRPLVYRVSTKSELRDVLQQAFGELSVLHVFVSIRSEAVTLPVDRPAAPPASASRRSQGLSGSSRASAHSGPRRVQVQVRRSKPRSRGSATTMSRPVVSLGAISGDSGTRTSTRSSSTRVSGAGPELQPVNRESAGSSGIITTLPSARRRAGAGWT